MGAGLGKPGDIVVGKFQPSRQWMPVPGAKSCLVGNNEVAGRPAPGKTGSPAGVASGPPRVKTRPS